MSSIGGGGVPPGPKGKVGDFADDQAGRAAKKKQDQQKTSKQRGPEKSRQAESAQKVREASQFESAAKDARSKSVFSGKEERGAARLTREPVEQGKQGPVEHQCRKAAGELGKISALLNQLSEVLDAADIIAGSFVDDKIGGQLAGKKQSKEKSAKDRQAADAKRQAAEDLQKLSEAVAAGGEGKEETPVAGLGEDRDLIEPGAELARRGPGGEGALSSGELVVALQERAAALMEIGARLGAEVDRAGLDEAVTSVHSYQALLNQAHGKFKGLMQTLLTGELGPLRREPYDQFRVLFEQVDQWPATIPPGRGCERSEDGSLTWSPQDWDAFLGWLVNPPVPADDLGATVEPLSPRE